MNSEVRLFAQDGAFEESTEEGLKEVCVLYEELRVINGSSWKGSHCIQWCSTGKFHMLP